MTGIQALPRLLFHGTSSQYIDRIAKFGLDPATSCYDHICLTSSIERATWFGNERCRYEQGPMMMITIETATLSPDLFTHEMGWIGNSLFPHEADIALAAPPLDMLSRYGVIGYKGFIQPHVMTIALGGLPTTQ